MSESVLSGGSASSSYNNTLYGGNAGSSFVASVTGGNASSSFSIPPNFSELLIAKLNNGNRCWSEFNEKHRYHRFLVEFARMSSLVNSEDIPDAPIPADNDELDC